MSDCFKNSKWICADKTVSSPIISKRFSVLDNVKKAVLHVTGLGYFEALVNDKKVTDYLLLPVATDYEPRDLSRPALYYKIEGTTGTSRIYYYSFDVTDLLIKGENLLTVQLANGWYLAKDFGDTKKAIFSIEITTNCGTFFVNSDGTESWTESPIKYNNIFTGETVDYTKIDLDEKPVSIAPSPNSILSKEIGTPDKIIRSVPYKLINQIDGRKIYDLGESVSAVVRVKTSAKKNSKITLRFAELLTEENDLFFNFGIGAEWMVDNDFQIMKDVFITDGSTRVFQPKFVWHAFRYFDIEGDFDELEVLEIHSDTPVTSSFDSDSEGLNFLYNSFIATQLGNMHGSFPSDCPHRERIGYTGDGQVCTIATMMTISSREFYRKWIQDILDCQMEDGYVHHTAPYYGGAGGPGVWGSAIVYVPYNYYLQYGDLDVLKSAFSGMLKWVKYLSTCLEDGLLTHEVESSLSLGDWANVGGVRIPAEYVNSCCFIKVISLVLEIASIVDSNVDLKHLHTLKDTITNSVISKYLDANKISFAGSIQGADVFAVWCGIAGKKTIEHVAKTYENMNFFDTGFMGTDLLVELLFDNGYADIAYNLLESREKGTFLYMKDNGATTLWENWGGGRMSRFHPMFGGCSRHIFSSILGIKQAPNSVGYKKVIISPKAPAKMNFASGKMTTPYGEISVSWKRVNGKIIVDYSVPDEIEVVKQ